MSRLKGLREWIGTIADLLAIGGFIVLSGGGIAYWLRHRVVPAWALVGAATIAVVALAVLSALNLGRRRRARAPLDELRRQVDQLSRSLQVASNYLSQVDDFLWGIREAFVIGRADRADALRRLEKLRPLVMGAVVQGINSTRDEQIRCAYFVQVDEGNGPKLMAKHHHGHSHRVEKLRLDPDKGSIAGIAFTTGDSVYVDNAAEDPRMQQVPQGRLIGSLLCVPVFGYSEPRSAPIGVFSVASSRVRAFTRADQEFASVCGSLLVLIDAGDSSLTRLDDAEKREIAGGKAEHTTNIRA